MTRHLLMLLATASSVAAGPVETYWGQLFGQWGDDLSWTNGVPDASVTAIFDLETPDFDNLVQFEEVDGVADRLIIRNGGHDFWVADIFGVEEEIPRHLDTLNPLFTSPSLVVGDLAGFEAGLSLGYGLIQCAYVVVGETHGSTGMLDFFGGGFAPLLFPTLVSDTHIHVGLEGVGTMELADECTVLCSELVIGSTATGVGEVDVLHPDATLDCFNGLIAGKSGTGVMTITGGADVTCFSAIIGQREGSQGDVTVTGIGSRWFITHALDVGLEGVGSLTIDAGGLVLNDGFATIGTFPPQLGEPTGGVGAAIVDGPASGWFNEGDLFVGFQSEGHLDVLNGAAVTSATGVVGADPDQIIPIGAATISGPGSVWAMPGTLTIFSTLRLDDGGEALAAVVDVAGLATGDGTIVGDVVNRGTIMPGDPDGTLTIEGSYEHQAVATVAVELSDAGGGTLAVTDTASVSGGVVEVSLDDEYAPAPGDAFTLFTAGIIFGGFDTIMLPDIAPDLWDLAVEATAIELRVIGNADLDGNGNVGTSDMLDLIGAWGPCPPGDCPADLDGDDAVGTTDLLLLFEQWSV